MNFIGFKNEFGCLKEFSLADIRAFDSGFDRRRLSEWQEKGYIRKICRGHYIFSDIQMDENMLFKMANRLRSPSYVSLESVFFLNRLVPEAVYSITSVSTRRTFEIQTPFSRFTYRKLDRKFFFGYEISDGLRIASPEKAVLDYFYLNAKPYTFDDFDEMRFSREEFHRNVNMDALNRYAKQFEVSSLSKRISLLVKWIGHND
jgi:predicted transcriptional regulator of viral defense system